jgi:hypothetical protein
MSYRQATRAEYLQWAKDRALAFLKPKQNDFFGRLSQRLRHTLVPLAEADQVIDAWDSLVSDLAKHPELVAHPAIMAGTLGMLDKSLRTVGRMQEFINGIQ